MNANISPVLTGSDMDRGGAGGPFLLLREGGEHAEISEVLNVVVGGSLGGISSHG